MPQVDMEMINDLKIQHIQQLLEQTVTDMLLKVFHRLAETQKRLPETVCYRSDCPKREDIPF